MSSNSLSPSSTGSYDNAAGGKSHYSYSSSARRKQNKKKSSFRYQTPLITSSPLKRNKKKDRTKTRGWVQVKDDNVRKVMMESHQTNIMTTSKYNDMNDLEIENREPQVQHAPSIMRPTISTETFPTDRKDKFFAYSTREIFLKKGLYVLSHSA
mmetsp:Transcript_54585/g.65819  ORF Transcript_54585/g.65819 Transcript_54585/m.65819 type:complete len:154 (-) Transcript_54585:744-1205(-)